MTRHLAFVALLALSGCASQYFRDAGAPPAPPPRHSLANLPEPEYWNGIVFNGNKVGFAHTRVKPGDEPGRYVIESEALIRFRFLGYQKNVQMHTRDHVDESGRLQRFDYRYVLDDSVRTVRGGLRDGFLRYTVGSGERVPEPKEERLVEPVYPTGVLSLLPVLRGLEVGRAYGWLVFNGETQSLERATQSVDAYETSELFPGAAFKVTTKLFGLSTTTWIDARGRPVFELGLNGVLISALESEATAKRYLAHAALAKSDVIVDWSLVKANLPLADPRRARYLRFSISQGDRVPPSDGRQRCSRGPQDVTCEIDAARRGRGESPEAGLRASAAVQAEDPAIRLLAAKITAGKRSASEKIASVLAWLDANIRKEPVDAFSALDVLDTRRAECQGHAYLYAAFMRSLGVPTRIVNGLVYAAEYGGFLYHTWAESLVDGSWQAVDPTFNQARADATHIGLARGETLTELIPLVDWVGKTRIEVLEAR